MYRPKHFVTQEYVPADFYSLNGEIALMCMDERVLITDDRIREYFGKSVTINNWHLGGDRQQSGLRTERIPGCAACSQHFYGRASDKLIDGVSPQEFIALAKSGKLGRPGLAGSVLEFVTRIEETFSSGKDAEGKTLHHPITWVHTDCGNQLMPIPLINGIQFIQA